MPSPAPMERRVLVVAPTGSDAANAVKVLQKGGFHADRYATVAHLAEQLAYGCGALLLSEEALYNASQGVLVAALARQPKWSNIPILLITSAGRERVRANTKHGFKLQTYLTLLERPLRLSTLLSAVEVALGMRDQQYEIRNLMEEREKLLGSLEERVAERTVELQTMVEEMEAFSYSVSHDLRAPLRVLDGYAQALQEDYAENLPPPARHLLDRISTAAKRMDRLTQDLLAYTRIANQGVSLEPTDLDSVLEDVIESYPSLREARQFISVDHPLGRVLAHGPSLVQCLSNLLENAVKFTPAGTAPQITISSKPADDHIRLTITDRGLGIHPDNQDRIFSLFERGQNKQISGTGVGLAIVKKAVQRMNGEVGVRSVPGNGSTFWLVLKKAGL